MRQVNRDVSRLPKWAQDKIAQLEREVKYHKNQISELHNADSVITWSQGIPEGDHGLPRHATIEFDLSEKGKRKKVVRVYMPTSEYKKGRLNINVSGGRLLVHPGASNDIDVSIGD